MQTQLLNYRIIIEPEINAKTQKKVYVAIVPKLGISDWGKSVEQALERTKEAILCHLESLAKHGKEVPETDTNEFMVTNAQINFNDTKFTFAI